MNFGPHHAYFTGKNNNFLIWRFTCMLRGWGYWPVQLHGLIPGVTEPGKEHTKTASHRAAPSCRKTPPPPRTLLCSWSRALLPVPCQPQLQECCFSHKVGEHMSVCKRLLDSLSRTWNSEWAVVSPATHQQIEFQARPQRANNRFSFFFNISIHVSPNIHALPWHCVSKANTHWKWAFYLYFKHPLVCMSTFNEPSENPWHSKTAFYISYEATLFYH